MNIDILESAVDLAEQSSAICIHDMEDPIDYASNPEQLVEILEQELIDMFGFNEAGVEVGHPTKEDNLV